MCKEVPPDLKCSKPHGTKMSIPSDYSFTRYLSSKKTVDDRALNQVVWQRLAREVSRFPADRRLRILEIGAGIGTMVERCMDRRLLRRAEYTALDAMRENIEEAASRVPNWAENAEYSVRIEGANTIRLTREDRDVMVKLETADVLEFMVENRKHASWDLLIANAFLDLVDVPSVLPDLLSLLGPKGLFYFTITFDAATIFQPEIDPELDARIEALYHQTMDQRVIGDKVSGDSRTGRHLFGHLRSAGAELLAAGSSDWVVFAGPEGYNADEAFFLHFIIHTVGSALRGHPELDPDRLAKWVAERHAQIERGDLVYIAHQLDFLGRV